MSVSTIYDDKTGNKIDFFFFWQRIGLPNSEHTYGKNNTIYAREQLLHFFFYFWFAKNIKERWISVEMRHKCTNLHQL